MMRRTVNRDEWRGALIELRDFAHYLNERVGYAGGFTVRREGWAHWVIRKVKERLR